MRDMSYRFNGSLGLFLLLMLMVLMGCSTRMDPSEDRPNPVPSANEMIDMNIRMMRAEQDYIQQFLAEREWEMEESGTGLRMVWLHESAASVKPTVGSVVALYWQGAPLDRWDAGFTLGDTLLMRVDRDDQIAALHEAVKSMHVGDKLRLIVPSHLGYGVHGKGEEVPSRASLLCEVELLAINP